MLKRARPVIWTIVLVGLLLGCSPPSNDQGELLVFAPASLANALDDVQEAFEAQTGVSMAVSYGGSQMLAQQIASGAPADVFISAGESPVKFLADKDRLEPTLADLLTNKLVVVVRSAADFRVSSMDQLKTDSIQRIALADPQLAPAGGYARESLESLGLWKELQSKLVLGADVRATLAYVESGNADAAIVYATDARVARNVDIFDIVPADSYSRIVYPVAIVEGSADKRAVTEFIDFLMSAKAQDIFRTHSFELAE